MTEYAKSGPGHRRHIPTQESKGGRQLRKQIQMKRFVISVDGQRKAGFSEHESAVAEAQRIKHAYPSVTVTVVDQEEDIIHLCSDKRFVIA
jgi:hypothetical protein